MCVPMFPLSEFVAAESRRTEANGRVFLGDPVLPLGFPLKTTPQKDTPTCLWSRGNAIPRHLWRPVFINPGLTWTSHVCAQQVASNARRIQDPLGPLGG